MSAALGCSHTYERPEDVFAKLITICTLYHKDLWRFRLINVIRCVDARRKVVDRLYKLIDAQWTSGFHFVDGKRPLPGLGFEKKKVKADRFFTEIRSTLTNVASWPWPGRAQVRPSGCDHADRKWLCFSSFSFQ